MQRSRTAWPFGESEGKRAQGFAVTGPSGERQLLRVEERADGSARVITPWGDHETSFVRRKDELWAVVAGRRLHARIARARPSATGVEELRNAGLVCSPMPGKLLRLLVSVGDEVRTGQALAVIEAMKMENELLAPSNGLVEELPSEVLSTVEKGALIARLKLQ